MSKIALALTLMLSCGSMLGCGAEAPPATVDASPPPPPPAVEAPPAAPAATVIDIPNAKMPIAGILVGGQPSVEQLEQAAQAGYRTIVNLRSPGEKGSWDEAAKAATLGLRYVAIPMAGADGLTAENAQALAEIVDDPQALPAMVHCASGNRVGGLFAMRAFHFDGKSAESALAVGREAGLTSLEDAVKERLTR